MVWVYPKHIGPQADPPPPQKKRRNHRLFLCTLFCDTYPKISPYWSSRCLSRASPFCKSVSRLLTCSVQDHKCLSLTELMTSNNFYEMDKVKCFNYRRKLEWPFRLWISPGFNSKLQISYTWCGGDKVVWVSWIKDLKHTIYEWNVDDTSSSASHKTALTWMWLSAL